MGPRTEGGAYRSDGLAPIHLEHARLSLAGLSFTWWNVDYELKTGIAILERTPNTLQAMLDGLPISWLEATEGPETWSAIEVVAHLAHAERTNWIPRATVIVNRTAEGRFPPFDRFAHLQQAGQRTMSEHLADFARLRAESLATLRGWELSEVELSQVGQHPEFGAVTLRQLLATWVVHDFTHLAQITRVMAKQYREAVGPWQSYLSIMK